MSKWNMNIKKFNEIKTVNLQEGKTELYGRLNEGRWKLFLNENSIIILLFMDNCWLPENTPNLITPKSTSATYCVLSANILISNSALRNTD